MAGRLRRAGDAPLWVPDSRGTGALTPVPECSGPSLVPAKPAEESRGGTFRVLKQKEEKQFGEYRTRRLVLEAWERLERGH